MKRITAAEFKQAIELDPAWASKLTEPIEIEGFCYMDGVTIESLPSLLTFLGDPDKPNGVVASFQCCTIQKVAATFHGPVDFEGATIDHVLPETTVITTEWEAVSFKTCKIRLLEGTYQGRVNAKNSSIQEIGQLTAINPDSTAASFNQCEDLQIARGTYHGFVDFSNSSIQEIDPTGLTIIPWDGTDEEDINSACFDDCENLKVARGTFPGFVSFRRSGIEAIDTHPETGLKVTGTNRKNMSADISDCPNLTHAAGDFFGQVNFIRCPQLKTGTPKTLKGQTLPVCCLDETPLLKNDPILAGMLMFQIQTRSPETILKAAKASWQTKPLSQKIEQILMVRNTLKHSGTMEI